MRGATASRTYHPSIDRHRPLHGRLWVTPGTAAALTDPGRAQARLLVRAYREAAHLHDSPNPFTPELAPLRPLFRPRD
jgi:hypothetical protein